MGILATVPWTVILIVLPLGAATLAVVLDARAAAVVGRCTAVGLVFSAIALAYQLMLSGPHHHLIGGWGAPLGIDLRADGLSVTMLLMSCIVGSGISFYASGYFSSPLLSDGQHHTEHSSAGQFFWPLWLFLWAALHALFLSADVFNWYVTLELVGLGAVALVNLAGDKTALVAGMRYLLASFVGSMVYLLGVALLYGAFGTLDVSALGEEAIPGPTFWIAMALMTGGLLLKTALFPLHFWLPAAHANAPAPVSAALSSLVIKGAFYLLLRLWFEVFPTATLPSGGVVFGILGSAAILWGSCLALCQERLKLLIAYSTVAQIGYLFLLFPLQATTQSSITAWSGSVYHALSHASAKAAMFMVAGSMLRTAGHDRISGLARSLQSLPISMFAFGIAGVSIMGLPPSGGFIAKWLILNAALQEGHWWLAGVILLGGLLAAGYIFLVVRHAFMETSSTDPLSPVPLSMELSALFLAGVALALGLFATPLLTILAIGAPIVDGITPGGHP
ncbi:MAG: complex I subunit 5 family protein [Candidatus Binatia bacterium]